MEEMKLRNFNEEEMRSLIEEGLSIRPLIEKTIDEIFEKHEISRICFVGIGGTLASAMQAETYMESRSKMDVSCLSAAQYCASGNKRVDQHSLFIYSSVSGNTKEMLEMAEKAKQEGVVRLAFVDTKDSELEKLSDYCIVSKKNEQLKFFMVCNYLMYRKHEMDDYEQYNRQMEEGLADLLIGCAKSFDEKARQIAYEKAGYIRMHPDMPHYMVAAGINYGAIVSHGMCYWEEQLWIRTRVVHSSEFFHGCFEVIEEDTPVILYLEEGSQRKLSLRVKDFLEKHNKNFLIIDSREYHSDVIEEKYRESISHLIIRTMNDRIDAYLEHYLDHPLETRRYYRKIDY